MLPECPILNVRNSLVEKTGQKEERVYKGFVFFPPNQEGNNIFLLFGYSHSATGGGLVSVAH